MAITRKTTRASPPRKSERTQATIVEAATRVFAARGYDAAGMRDIAAAAKVNPALINIYFGSKAALFRQVVDRALSHAEMIEGDLDQLAERWASFTITGISRDRKRMQASKRALQLLMRSAGSDTARLTVRDIISEQIVDRVATRLHGAHAQERAALIATYLLGFAMMQRVIGIKALAEGDSDSCVRYLTQAIQRCIAGEP
jgi:AcrR family transcriptional regulator